MVKRRAGRPKGSVNKSKKTGKKCCTSECTKSVETKAVADGTQTPAFELAVRVSGLVQNVAAIGSTLNQLIQGMNDMGGSISKDMQALTARVAELENKLVATPVSITPAQMKLALAPKPTAETASIKDII